MKEDKETNLDAAPTLCPLSTELGHLSISLCVFDVTISGEVLGY